MLSEHKPTINQYSKVFTVNGQKLSVNNYDLYLFHPDRVEHWILVLNTDICLKLKMKILLILYKNLIPIKSVCK